MFDVMSGATFLVGSVWFSLRQYRFLLTPLTVFFGVWFVIIAAYAADPFLFDLFSVRVTTYAAVLRSLSFFVFFAGGATPFMLGSRRPSEPSVSAQDAGRYFRVLLAWTVWIVLALIAGVGYEYAIVASHYGNAFDSLPQIRGDFVQGRLVLPAFLRVTTLFENVAVLNLGILLANARILLVFPLTVVTFAIVFLRDITIADGEGLRLCLVLGFSAYYATTILRKRRPRVLSYIPYALFVIMVTASYSSMVYFRVGPTIETLIARSQTPVAQAPRPQTSSSRPLDSHALVSQVVGAHEKGVVARWTEYLKARRAWLFDVSVRHFYADIVGNFVSSSWFVSHPLPARRIGENTFSGMYTFARAMLPTVAGHRSSPSVEKGLNATSYAPIVRVGVYNTTDYLAYIYSDFGVWGVVLLSYTLGVVCIMVFLRAMRLLRISDVEMLAFLMAAIAISTRGFYFGAVGFWFTLVCILAQGFALNLACSRSSRRPDVALKGARASAKT